MNFKQVNIKAVDIPDEKWIPIPGYKRLYDVSSLGRIRSYRKERSSTILNTSRIIKGGIIFNGYRKFTLYNINRQKKSIWLHRIVCESFNGKCPPGMECAHIDGKPFNNKLINLVWKTKSDNEKDKVIHGTSNRGENCGTAKLTKKNVVKIQKLASSRKYSQKELSLLFGVKQPQISRIINKKRWSYEKF